MKRQMLTVALAPFVVVALTGCMHVAGTVVDASTQRPLQGATLTVGHPAGLGVFDRHVTDANGKFSFYISPTDESHLYLHDGRSNPSTARRIDRSEISNRMRLSVRVVGGAAGTGDLMP